MIQRNPNHNKFVKPEGYTDWGWQLTVDRHEGLAKHYTERHQSDEFDNSMYMHRATDVIRICHACKAIWHTDMSD